MQIDYDNIPAEIERLHSEAEACADLAKRSEPEEAVSLRLLATSKVRTAAALRSRLA